MHRIDSEGSQNGAFVDEDQSRGIPGTILPAVWLNTVQNELINVYKEFGGTDAGLSKGASDQVAKALAAKFTAIDTQIKTLQTYVNSIYDVVNDLRDFVINEIGKEPATPPSPDPTPSVDITLADAVYRIAASLGPGVTRPKITQTIRALPAKQRSAQLPEPEPSDS